MAGRFSADLRGRLHRIQWAGATPVLDRPFLLLLDEIDVHLHPAWQRKILPAVQKLFPAAQIIVSTHSPFVVASIEDAWVYPLAMRGGRVVLDPPVPSQAGTSFAAVLKGVFGIEEEFDVDTERLFAEFYRLRDAIFTGDRARRPELAALAIKLEERGLEVRDIVQAELRQLDRRTAATGTS
jgi:ABC-type multidrug transport system ATPase subunit